MILLILWIIGAAVTAGVMNENYNLSRHYGTSYILLCFFAALFIWPVILPLEIVYKDADH